MRSIFVLVATLAAVIVGLAPEPAPAVELAPSAAGAGPGASYPLHLKFNLLYEVDWSHSGGLEGLAQDDCASWSKNRGITTVVAQDAPWKRKKERRARRHGIPGSLIFSGGGQTPPWASGQWASGSAVGRAKATVHRRWV